MKVVIHLDLSQYELTTLQRLYWEKLITKEEFVEEMKSRSYDDFTILSALRGAKVMQKLQEGKKAS